MTAFLFYSNYLTIPVGSNKQVWYNYICKGGEKHGLGLNRKGS